MSQGATAGAGWSAVRAELRMAVLRGWNDMAMGKGFPRSFDKLDDEEQKNYERGRLMALSYQLSGYELEPIGARQVVRGELPPLEFEIAGRCADGYAALPPPARQKMGGGLYGQAQGPDRAQDQVQDHRRVRRQGRQANRAGRWLRAALRALAGGQA